MTPPDDLYSVRMRATSGNSPSDGCHLSGGERLVEAEQVDAVSAMLTKRAIRAGAKPGAIRIGVSRIPKDEVSVAPALPVTTVLAADSTAAIDVAVKLLAASGVNANVARWAFNRITSGPVTSGAHVVNLVSGEVVDNYDQGVRVSRLDYTDAARREIEALLATGELPHSRTADALAIATKVIWGEVTAELCWSDDPQYEAGYVATAAHGYVRFPHFKLAGAVGGRVLFAPWTKAFGDYVECLRRRPLLIDLPIVINPSVSARTFLREKGLA